MTASPPADHERLGIACMLVSGALFSITNVVIKQLSGTYPTTEVMFFRNLFALPVALAIVWHGGGIAMMKTTRIFAHMQRAAIGLGAMGLLFYALKVLPVGDAVAIYFATPLVVMVLSGPILGERPALAQWMAASIGFVGVVLIVRPGLAGVEIGALAALGSCLFYAFIALFLRTLSRTEPTPTIIWYYTLFCTLVTGCFFPFGWSVPTGPDLALFALLGFAGGGAQYFLTHAYRSAPASLVTPFDYAQLLWTMIAGWVVFSEMPTPVTWAGATLIVGSGLYLLRRQAGRQASA